MDLSVSDAVSLLRDGGLSALLLLVLVGGFRKWWVWGYQLTEMQLERDEWKAMFLRTLNVAETAVSVAKKSGE